MQKEVSGTTGLGTWYTIGRGTQTQTHSLSLSLSTLATTSTVWNVKHAQTHK